MDFGLSPDWGKYGGLPGMMAGGVITVLAFLVLRVLPRANKNEGDRGERWLNKVLDTFSEQARLERQQCSEQYRETLGVYHRASEACAARDLEIMASQRELITAQRATAHALKDLAHAITLKQLIDQGGLADRPRRANGEDMSL